MGIAERIVSQKMGIEPMSRYRVVIGNRTASMHEDAGEAKAAFNQAASDRSNSCKRIRFLIWNPRIKKYDVTEDIPTCAAAFASVCR